MAELPRYFITTAIDYPNSRPHIGTAFEKLGADVQARYRRMQGFDVFFLMGNDENTVKVSRKAAELSKDAQAYCNEMADQFKEVWRALDVSFDDFIQTSEPRHHAGCRQFIQKVHDAGYIRKGGYEGWYCEGCEEFKTDTDVAEAGGLCPNHRTPVIRRVEECYFFELTKFQDRLLQFYEQNPDFIQPESRRNEVLSLVQSGLKDVNITRRGEDWGIRVPFDEQFTIYVWFDALLNYITAIGYGADDERFMKWWPADVHVIGKDITRFHCALWPAMLIAAGLEPPRLVFGHGFVYVKNEETGDIQKISKSLGNVVEPMDLIEKFSAEGFRYYFLSQCPFPGDGEFSWLRFKEAYNADLANNLGNLYSRTLKLITANFGGRLEKTEDLPSGVVYNDMDIKTTVQQVRDHIEAFQYNQALQKIWLQVLNPSNQYADRTQPWKVVKTEQKDDARGILYDMVEQLRTVSILLKPFLPRVARTIYTSFNFPMPWDEVRYEEIWAGARPGGDLVVTAELDDKGNVRPLFPRIN